MRNRIYYIIESVNVSLTKIFLDLSGYVMYDTLEEAEGDLDVRGTEAVYIWLLRVLHPITINLCHLRLLNCGNW